MACGYVSSRAYLDSNSVTYLRDFGPFSGRSSLQTLPWLSLMPDEARAETTADALSDEYCLHEQVGLFRLEPWRQSPHSSRSGWSCDGTVRDDCGGGGVSMRAEEVAPKGEVYFI